MNEYSLAKVQIIIANLVVFIHIVSRGVKILHEESPIYDLLTPNWRFNLKITFG